MTRHRDPRFFALVDLAAAGNEEAVHELWLVYRYDFEREGDPRNRQPTQPLSAKQNHNQKES